MSRFIKQCISFFSISLIGWIIDFTVFILFSTIIGIEVFYSNILSAIPAITFVFFTSTKRRNRSYT
ncbi:hypothetical protein J1TS5_08800 [Paenibacillus macerans]|nr:hypothetical protein J1TS5_08800 [Paenibacillus macerans]